MFVAPVVAVSLLTALVSTPASAQHSRGGGGQRIVVQPQVLLLDTLRKTHHVVQTTNTELCEGYSGCWGFTDGGKEYAAVACATGVWIVEVHPVTGAMTEIGFLWRASQLGSINNRSTPWRDVVAYTTQAGRQFVFSVSDGPSIYDRGLHVIEVTNIAQGVTPTEYIVSNFSSGQQFLRAHTISLDEQRGHLHLSGVLIGGTLQYCIIDVSNFVPNGTALPTLTPVVLASHSSFVRNDRTYIANGVQNIPAFDIPTLLASPNPLPPSSLLLRTFVGLAHSSWVTEDGSFCVGAVESLPGVLEAFDLSSTASPIQGYAWFASAAGCAPTDLHTPHYAYGIGRNLYVAHYTDGFHFVELGTTASAGFRPIASYDTSADGCPPAGTTQKKPVFNNPSQCGQASNLVSSLHYHGAWDVYPYQDSGVVYVTDTASGLWAFTIPVGHFHRTENGYSGPASQLPIPNAWPDGAAPREGTAGFQFRATNLDPTYWYEIIAGTQAINQGQSTPVEYVSGIVNLPRTRVKPTSSTHNFPGTPNEPSFTPRFAQVIGWDSQVGGQIVAHSRLIDFQLLRQ